MANLEFIQFHPTCLYHPNEKSFLISEAVRGEGGQLKLPDGTRFMPQHDARDELAPRDIVARAIDFEMKKHGLDCVHLDISHQSPQFLKSTFPTSWRAAPAGHRHCQEPIPVVPAAHYTCGGVLTDLARAHRHCQPVRHWRNRLHRPARGQPPGQRTRCWNAWCLPVPLPSAFKPPPCRPSRRCPCADDSRVADADEAVVISHNWDELRRFMWDYVGIVRTNKRLERAAHRIALLQSEIQEFYANFHVTRDLLELRNLVQVAELIVRSAQMRHESRGLHFSRDWPDLAAPAASTILVPPVK